MKFTKVEHHQVNSIFTYDIPEEDIIETFGSVERFKEIASHMTSNDWNDAEGDEPTDEENDAFVEFIENYNYDREDDWWTDRKGGYDVSYEVGDDA
jgi:hypothetical protein